MNKFLASCPFLFEFWGRIFFTLCSHHSRWHVFVKAGNILKELFNTSTKMTFYTLKFECKNENPLTKFNILLFVWTNGRSHEIHLKCLNICFWRISFTTRRNSWTRLTLDQVTCIFRVPSAFTIFTWIGFHCKVAAEFSKLFMIHHRCCIRLHYHGRIWPWSIADKVDSDDEARRIF